MPHHERRGKREKEKRSFTHKQHRLTLILPLHSIQIVFSLKWPLFYGPRHQQIESLSLPLLGDIAAVQRGPSNRQNISSSSTVY